MALAPAEAVSLFITVVTFVPPFVVVVVVPVVGPPGFEKNERLRELVNCLAADL